MGNLWNWIEYDYFERYSTLHESEVRQKLHLPPATYRSLFEPSGRQVFREFMDAYGETLERFLQEFSRRIGHTGSYGERFLMNRSIDAIPVISWYYNDFCEPGISLPDGLGINRYWPYFTPDGQSVYGHIVSITDGTESAKLPVTMWRTKFGDYYRKDLLAWPDKFPLFRLDRLQLAEIVYICQGEEQVEKAETKYGAECGPAVMFTTWPGGFDFALSKVDWEYLRGRRVAVMAEDKREEFQLALKIAKQLSKIECEFVGFKLLYYDRESTSSTLCFSDPYDVQKEMRTGVSSMPPDRFARYAYEKYGVGEPIGEEIDDSVEKLMKEPDEPDDWVIPHLIHQGERIMVYAKPKEGKTTFLLQAAILMARHGKKIAYFDAEMPLKTSKKHLRKGCGGKDSPKNFRFISAAWGKLSLNFEVPENQNRWKAYCNQSDVIILDNLNKMFPTSLGSDASSSRILDVFIEKWWRLGKTVILVHHANLSGRQFGTAVKSYSLDLTLKVEKREGYTKITPEEVRSLPEKYGKAFEIPYDDETGLSEDWFDPEKRYLCQKSKSKKRENVEKQSCAVKEKTGDAKLIMEVQENNLEKDNSLVEEVPCSSNCEKILASVSEHEPQMDVRQENKKEKVRKLLAEQPHIKVEEIVEKLGKGFRRSTVYKLLKKIREEEAEK